VANRSPEDATLASHPAGGALGRRTLTAFVSLTFAFLYLPVVVLVVYSFNEAKVFAFPPGTLSLKWYVELFNDRDMHQSIVNSLIVAAGVIPVTLLLGVPAAFTLDRFEFWGKAAFERAVMLPLMIPGLITGLAILLVIKRVDLSLSLVTVIIGHSVAWLPIVITQVFARLRRFDRRLEEASMDLGANRWQTFLRVTLPNIHTAVLGSALLVFTLSFDEIAITFFLTGADNTLPMHIWSMLREGISPEIAAIATITVSASITVMLLGLRLLGGSSRVGAQ
jgi:spermidine/putrescine transport system permease protein